MPESSSQKDRELQQIAGVTVIETWRLREAIKTAESTRVREREKDVC